MSQLEQHPLAIKLMPGGMSDEEFAALCEDVEARGLIYPITLFEGKVLDGWHRYRATLKTGTALKSVEYTGKDPAGYIAACNVLRRRLSSLQRALVGARLHLDHAVPQREVNRRLGISNTVLAMVLKAIESRNAVIIKRIESDSDYTRGMLREELEDAGVVHANYGRSKKEEDAPPPPADPLFKPAQIYIAPSVFDLHKEQAPATDGIVEEDDEDLIGGPMPTVGKKPAKPERKAKSTAAQTLYEQYKELMYDEKKTFLQMIWPESRAIAEELALPGLGGKPAKGKLKAVA